MDSRTSAELVFDQGLGDIFSIRIAGNIVNPDVLGSIEYAVAAAGVKLVMVLGHTACGAVAGACGNVRMGNLSGTLARIAPAVQRVAAGEEGPGPYQDRVAAANVCLSIDAILEGERAWGNMKNYMKELLTARAQGGIEAEELLVFPGLEETFANLLF